MSLMIKHEAPPVVNDINVTPMVDVVLVLDKSGSMNDLPPDAGMGNMTTKVQILKSAVDAFVGNWLMLDAPTMDGGDWSNDRLGLVFFGFGLDGFLHERDHAGGRVVGVVSHVDEMRQRIPSLPDYRRQGTRQT